MMLVRLHLIIAWRHVATVEKVPSNPAQVGNINKIEVMYKGDEVLQQ